ncbi:cytochrome P450 71A1-like [Dendrobium catenatum]|nr:cytochrome P450 71A1-like [Dendrobium catenatum]
MALLLIPFILFLLHTLSATLRRKRKLNSRRRRLPPGPPSLPFIGHLHEFIGELPQFTLRKLSYKYGPLIHVKLGQVSTIIASSPETAAEILKTQDIVFCGRPFFASTDRFSYGGLDIAFTPYNDHWRRIRRFTNAEVFSAARVQAFKAIREEEVGALLKTISSASANGEAFNLTTMLLCLFNNLIYRLVFGKRISAVAGDCGRTQHHEMIMEAVAFTTELCVGDFFPSLAWLDGLTGWRGRLEKIFHTMDRVFEREIEERMKRRRCQEEKKSSTGEDTINEDVCFLDILLKSQEEMDDSLGLLLTRNVIKAVVMDMFLAGTDSPAIIMEWAMAELIKNPKSMRKAQEEVRRVVKGKGKVEEEDLQHLPYLHNVFKETLRLHPSGPLLLPRESTKDTKINGYDIPAKTRIFVNAWALARDPNSWGEDAETFQPERFDKCGGVDFKGHHLELIPFGAGRRTCPGMAFGVAGVELALANVLYGFDWELPSGVNREEMDMTESFRMVSHKKVPIIVVATPVTDFT